MYLLRKFLGSLEHHELVQLKHQYDIGKLNFEKELADKIKEHEKQHAKFCASCSNELDQYNTNNYTILFGPDDFKKKASFCGLDCLQYFLLHIKQMKEGDEHEQKIQ